MATPELIQELQEAIRQDYGVRVSFKEASNIADNLTGFFGLLAEINRKEKADHGPP